MSDDRRVLLLQALQAVEEMKAKLRERENAVSEPIAIVGMGCRFPGKASSPEALWRLLADGIDAVVEVPASRFGAAEIPEGSPQWHAGLVDGLDQFDPRFFGMSAREAVTLDPQQRMALEVSWEALENAGINPQTLNGSATGVFVGVTGRDYGQLILDAGYGVLDGYAATGTSTNAAAGRISFVLGLQGPAVAVDTACSSSLTAIHLACQSLRLRECRMALAGGTNALLSPGPFVCCDNWGMLAPDGRCKTFDARANGFVRAEGCGIVVLKRLADALADGDSIAAVIRGSAVNQDGRSSGLTVPNGLAQEAAIRQALGCAQLDPASIDYVEAHGTGTSLGDPIEAQALAAVLGQGRTTPLVVGAVKTNIGHLESAAGVAGVIKTVLALQHETIPRNLHFERTNPQIDWGGVAVEVPVRAREWKRGERVRRAGVSSFGFSGTNAHVILEEAPAAEPAAPPAPDRGVRLLALSARTAPALERMAASYADALAHADAKDVCFTANTGRARFSERAVYIAASGEELRRKLLAAPGEDTPGVFRGRARSREELRVAFLFSGQGGQYPGMGRDLYESEPVFRDAVNACAKAVEDEVRPGVLEVLYGAASDRIDDTYYTQPALFAVQYGLARLWQSRGVQPAFVMGHSAGEYAAACVAGFFSVEEGARFMAARGRLTAQLPKGEGGMAAILAPEEDVAAAVERAGGRVFIAGFNGPENVVISGWRADVERIAAEFTAAGMRGEVLRVWHGAHSPLVDAMVEPFGRHAAGVRFRAGSVGMVSSVTGRVTGVEELSDPGYWQRQVRQAVRFRQAVETLDAQGCRAFIEIGPGPALLGMGRQCVAGEGRTWTPSLRKSRPDAQQMAESLAELYTSGVEVDWAEYERGRGGRKVALPTYPFERQRYWIDTAGRKTEAPRASGHPLLGAPVDLAGDAGARVWQSRIDTASLPWVADHRIQGRTVLPATAYVEMASAAARETSGDKPVRVTGFEFVKPLFVEPDTQYRLQTTLAADRTIRIYAKTGDSSWALHASARLQPAAAVEALPAMGDEGREVGRPEIYARLAELGNDFGPAFQLVTKARIGADRFEAEVEVPDMSSAADRWYRLHPAVADACGHGLAAIRAFADAAGGAGSIVGEGLGEVCVFRTPESRRLICRGAVQPSEDPSLMVGSVTVEEPNGAIVSSVSGVRLRYLETAEAERPGDSGEWFYRLDWEEFTPSELAPDRMWIVTGEDPEFARETAASLRVAGLEAVVGDACAEIASLAPDAAAGVVYTGGLAAHAPEAGESPGEATGCAPLLRLLRQMHEIRGGRDLRLYAVTRGAQAAAGVCDPKALWQAPLWGLGRILAVEHAELWGGLVDLDPAADAAASAEALCGVLNFVPADDQVAIRNGRMLCPRLERCRMPGEEAAPRFRADGAYLVTGGLGGLGLETARWMASRGARRIALVSRRAPKDRAAIDRIEAHGATVEVATFDIADPAALESFLEARRQSGAPPFRGVVHAAGVLVQEPALETGEDALDRVLRPKLAAHDVCARLAEDGLDFVVLFSSAASIHGVTGQAAYAAANAFLDFLPHARPGDPIRCINWGLWTEAGMAVQTDAAAVRRHERRGLGGLTNAQGLAALGRALAGAERNVAVIPIDWAAWASLYPDHATAPILSRVMAERRAAPAATASGAAALRDRLAAAPEADRLPILETYLAGVLGAVSGFAASEVDPARPVTDYGIDSLMAVEFKNRVQRELGNVVTVVQLLEGAPVRRIAQAALGKLVFETPAAAEAAAPAAVDVDALTDAEVDAMLSGLLAQQRASGA